MASTSYEKWLASAASARERAAASPELIPHGSRTGYQYWDCRCCDCRDAERLAQAARRACRKARRGLPLSDFDRDVLDPEATP